MHHSCILRAVRTDASPSVLCLDGLYDSEYDRVNHMIPHLTAPHACPTESRKSGMPAMILAGGSSVPRHAVLVTHDYGSSAASSATSSTTSSASATAGSSSCAAAAGASVEAAGVAAGVDSGTGFDSAGAVSLQASFAGSAFAGTEAAATSGRVTQGPNVPQRGANLSLHSVLGVQPSAFHDHLHPAASGSAGAAHAHANAPMRTTPTVSLVIGIDLLEMRVTCGRPTSFAFRGTLPNIDID